MKLSLLIIATSIALFSSASYSQQYPAKPVKVIVPYAPGGTGDIVARLVAQQLSTQTGQQFIVENRTGAGGLIGYGAAVKSPSDGYTLVAMDSSYTMFPALYGSRIGWNIESDLIPVTISARAPFALVVNTTKPYKNVGDLIRLAKERPGEITFGTPGTGTLHHVFTSLLMSTVGVQMTHIPYRGASDAMVAVLGNNVDSTFVAMPTISSQLSNDRIRVIAVTSAARSVLVPNVPTLRESGIPLTVANWFGLAAPKGTSTEIVNFLSKQVAEAVKSPEVLVRLKSMGAEAVGNTPAEFDGVFRGDLKLWTKVIRDAGIKID